MATAHRVNSRALKSILALYMYAVYKSSHPFLMDYLLEKICWGTIEMGVPSIYSWSAMLCNSTYHTHV